VTAIHLHDAPVQGKQCVELPPLLRIQIHPARQQQPAFAPDHRPGRAAALSRASTTASTKCLTQSGGAVKLRRVWHQLLLEAAAIGYRCPPPPPRPPPPPPAWPPPPPPPPAWPPPPPLACPPPPPALACPPPLGADA